MILFGVLVFGRMSGRYSSRQVEECCRYDVRYRWLLEGCEAPDHSTLSRFRGEALPEVAQELFGQLMGYLGELGELDYAHLFVDGTKQEANAMPQAHEVVVDLQLLVFAVFGAGAVLAQGAPGAVLAAVDGRGGNKAGFALSGSNSLSNITSPAGIQLQVNRSIVVEGGLWRHQEDYGFRRFLLRGKRKIQTELLLLAFAFDVRKLRARMRSKHKDSQLFEVRIA